MFRILCAGVTAIRASSMENSRFWTLILLANNGKHSLKHRFFDMDR